MNTRFNASLISLTATVAAVTFSSAPALAGSIGLGSSAAFGSFFTSATLEQDALTFDPNPGYVVNFPTTGDLIGFTAAEIESVLTFEPQTTTNNPFIDFGFFSDINLNFNPNTSSLIPSGTGSLKDEKFAFFLTDSSYTLGEKDGSLVVDIGLRGYFKGDDDIQTAGRGTITLQHTNFNKAAAEATLAGGGSIDGMSFSGMLVTVEESNIVPPQDVPEPLTILGTGLAFGFGGLFKVKNSKK